jgi:hypothetical protein
VVGPLVPGTVLVGIVLVGTVVGAAVGGTVVGVAITVVGTVPSGIEVVGTVATGVAGRDVEGLMRGVNESVDSVGKSQEVAASATRSSGTPQLLIGPTVAAERFAKAPTAQTTSSMVMRTSDTDDPCTTWPA